VMVLSMLGMDSIALTKLLTAPVLALAAEPIVNTALAAVLAALTMEEKTAIAVFLRLLRYPVASDSARLNAVFTPEATVIADLPIAAKTVAAVFCIELRYPFASDSAVL